MFKTSLSITLLGKIVESNADKVEGNTTTWYYTYKYRCPAALAGITAPSHT